MYCCFNVVDDDLVGAVVVDGVVVASIDDDKDEIVETGH